LRAEKKLTPSMLDQNENIVDPEKFNINFD
jgi:hypothetical protein